MTKEEVDKILDPKDFSWIKVKKDSPIFTLDEYYVLLEHHLRESNFLIEKCRELAAEIKRMQNDSQTKQS